MKNFYTSLSFGIALFIASLAAAQAADSAPTADAVLDKYVAAVGGKEAAEKFKTRVMKADFEGFGGTTEWAMYAKAPNKSCMEFEVAGFGQIQEGYDGSVAWSKNPNELRVKEGVELARAKFDSDFHRDLNLKKHLPGLTYKATEKLDKEEVHVLESKSSTSGLDRFYFNAKSGLLERHLTEFEGPNGSVSFDARLTDYKAVDGFKYPFTQTFKMVVGGQEMDFGIKIKEIKHNAEVTDAKFKKPTS